jgi:type IV pilus assembly protein PilQ
MDDAGNPKVEFEDAVLRLEITPNVIDANQLRMSILVKNDRVDDVRSVQGNPFIYKKETQTSLVAKSGETIVISGLTEEISGNQRQGVPGLMNIPGLGALFRRDKQDQEMSEMLIFITATILPERPVSLLTQPSQNTP